MAGDGIRYAGQNRRCVAMPLGGIGTGNVALSGTGLLKQWQLHNTGNHLGFLPQSFFALRLSCTEPPLNIRRVLQAPSLGPGEDPAPLVNDHLDAPGGYQPQFGWPLVRETQFTGAYPFAYLDYQDDWPVRVALEAYTPFVPLDAEASSLPMASFRFTITNDFTHDLTGWLLGSLQNAVGWDGATPITGPECAVLGGNVNQAESIASGIAILMTNPSIPDRDRGAGSMLIWTSSPAVTLPQFDNPDTALAFADSLKLLAPTVFEDWDPEALARSADAQHRQFRIPARPSAPGRTWAGCMAIPVHLPPSGSTAVELVVAWSFPHRYADFDQFGREDEVPREAAYMGNHYAQAYPDAASVIAHYAEHHDALHAASARWRDAIFGSGLPGAVRDALGAQPSLIRSPTTFRAASGEFFGFEGVLGESSSNWNGNIGGSCPLNCTHVWNYEQAVARLFPSLERSMRETDWNVLQAPEGYLPHRVLYPLTEQHFGRKIGGPDRPALDGMLGTVLKTYREARTGAGLAWLEKYLPNMRKLMDYVQRTWDADGSGLLQGDQPVTHDISLQDVNMYVGGIWLAALRTMEAVTGMLGYHDEAERYGRAFATSSDAYDDLLWNGEFYGQRSTGDAYDFGIGCLADQLFGQWWAHQLGLGHLLPADHVRTALASIVRYNLREGFTGFQHGYRSFADSGDTGLLVCTWPYGGRPTVPIRYADEVWSGVEYQVAGHLAYEGMTEGSLRLVSAIRARHDGRRRNPYNEIENGDHYSRAMAGWALLDAMTGSGYNALTGELRLGRAVSDYPVLAATGWARVRVRPDQIEVRCLGGSIEIKSVRIEADPGTGNIALPAVLAEDEVLTVSLTN